MAAAVQASLHRLANIIFSYRFSSLYDSPSYPLFIRTPDPLVFTSHSLRRSLKTFKKSVLQKLKEFFQELENKLHSINASTATVVNIQNQQLEAVNAELKNFTLDLMKGISKEQRDISRVMTPIVQSKMLPVYQVCSQQTGKGCFQTMKNLMEGYVHNHKSVIFNSASDELKKKLNPLQQKIQNELTLGAQNLHENLMVQFEPLLKPMKKHEEIIPEIKMALQDFFSDLKMESSLSPAILWEVLKATIRDKIISFSFAFNKKHTWEYLDLKMELKHLETKYYKIKFAEVGIGIAAI
ncbi:uncharacterized protein LOC102358259 [Latimeria chalumnae]|uniref:uncharacterized protein LOC102358259 n=1 Tax=Latimeria chalumnae TaxID=7897 RepID=UPI00313AE69E